MFTKVLSQFWANINFLGNLQAYSFFFQRSDTFFYVISTCYDVVGLILPFLYVLRLVRKVFTKTTKTPCIASYQRMSKKSWPNLYSNLVYKMGKDYLDIQ